MDFINNLLDVKRLSVDSVQCLNYKSSKVVCRRCLDSCPTKALQLEDTDLSLIERKCIDCTACVAACPVLALDFPRMSYQKVAQQIKNIPSVDVTCQEFSKYQKGIKIPCYQLLDPSLVMSWYNNNQDGLLLYVGKCNSCKYAEYYDMLERIQQLNAYCQRLDSSIEIQTTADADIFLKKQLNKTTQAAEGVTRRALLQKLRPGFLEKEQTSSKKTSEKHEQHEQQEQIQNKVELLELDSEQKNIYKRSLLQVKVNEQDDQVNDELPVGEFAQVVVSSSCDYCEVCTRVCPTKALKWHTDDEGLASLLFDCQKCIACKRCAICPQQAVTFSKLTKQQWLAGEQDIHKLQIHSCQECGNDFHVSQAMDNADICKWCKLEKQKKADLFNSL